MQVISRNEINTINSVIIDDVTHDLGVVKIFSQHPELARFIPSKSEIAISWVRLEKDQELSVHQHPEPSLILICDGSGITLGDIEKNITAGDMILVPPHSLHGFKGTSNGFWALSIQFNGKSLYEDILKPNVVFLSNKLKNEAKSPSEEILKYNKHYLENYKNSRLIKLVNSPLIRELEVRERLLDCLQIWSDVFQDLFHLRIATTVEPTQKKIALKHLVEELGHNDNLRKQRKANHQPVWDASFMSAMEWFRQQIFYKRDLVKTLLMHIVLEGSGQIFHSEAAAVFSDMPHFQAHGEDDDDHISMGVEPLNQATSKELNELREALNEGWNMITLLCNRIADLAESNRVYH